MIWKSSCNDQTQFCRSIQRDPDQVFVEGFHLGRKLMLTISTAIEMLDRDSSLIVTGRHWRVHVRRIGCRLHTLPIRTSHGRSYNSIKG